MATGGLFIAAACLVNLSFTIRSSPVNLWSQLGISESAGLENIKRTFLEGYLYSYGASAAKKIATGDRVAVLQDLMLYTRQYVSSENFKKEYENARRSAKPVPPVTPKSKEEIQKERIAELNKSIAEGQKSMQTLPADLVETFKEVQQMLKDQVKDYEDPQSPMLIMLADAEQFNYQNALRQYEINLEAWEKAYPADHSEMIKARLRRFLELTEGIDFNAALREEYRLKKFVNPVYEQKPAEWKMAYRSGKPVVDAARSFAQQWLVELK